MRESKYYQHKNLKPFLKFPAKCLSSQVAIRSSWEAKFVLKYLDINENIIEWKSEDYVIQYFCPTDGRNHRYFIDFWFKAKTKDGSLEEFLVEIKPFSECSEPKIPKRKTASYYKSVETYIKNQAKWQTARQICEQKRQQGQNIQFIIISERDCPWFIK